MKLKISFFDAFSLLAVSFLCKTFLIEFGISEISLLIFSKTFGNFAGCAVD